MRCLASALAVAIALAAGAGIAQAPVPVELELVLAIDASSSVDDAEYKLQMQGVIEAFRDAEVIDAIEAAGTGGIAVTVVQWSSAHRQKQIVPWTHVYETRSAYRFATTVAANDRRRLRQSTGLGRALQFCAALIENNSFEGRRKSIDVSGDGRNNSGPPPAPIREQVTAKGITINGLAILNENADLRDYYVSDVIGGDGAFVMTATDYKDVIEVMKHKLIREVAASLVSLPAVQPRS